MESMLNEIVRRMRTGEPVALCILVRTRGSTPQAAGAKMLVLADGKTIGTLGGGCVEAEVRTRALEQLSKGTSATFEFRLDRDYGWDDGLICGGIMDVLIHVPTDPAMFDQILLELRANRPAQLTLPYEIAGEQKTYTEELGPPPTLVIAGAGHVGQALATIATAIGFDLIVVDDRPEYACSDRFPGGRILVGDIETELRRFPIDPNTYVVIVTRGHRNDGRALAAVVNSPARYVGLIGSKRKIKAIFDDLAQQGVTVEQLERVHAPIGFEIGAVTPAEIAVSIAAELIAVRRGHAGAATAMKMDGEQLRQWIGRHKNSL